MVRQLHSAADGVSIREKKRKKLVKALRAIDELKAKRDAGEALEKTQLEKMEREDELRAELAMLMDENDEISSEQMQPAPSTSEVNAS